MTHKASTNSSQRTLKILLLTGTSPGEPGVGGVILRGIVEYVGAERMRSCIFRPQRVETGQHMPELSTKTLERRYEPAWRPIAGITGEMLATVATSLKRNPHVASLTEQVKREIQKYQPNMILCVLESITSIEVARRLIGLNKVKIRCIVWDDVKLLSDQANLDRWTSSQLDGHFREVLQASQRTAVICENMQDAYKRKYGINSIVLRHGIEHKISHEKQDHENLISPNSSREHFLIGFAGSITTPDCLKCLIESLDQYGWQFEGRDIVIRLLGARYLLDSRKPQRIEYYGWRDLSTTTELLAECDFLYLPQSFLNDLRHFSELSFPTKLSTYVVSRKPILLHAPDYASLAQFWKDYPAGPWCDSLNVDDLRSAIENVLTSTNEQRQQWLNTSSEIHRSFLSQEQFYSGIDQLIAQV